MRNPERIERIIPKLAAAWRLYPDLRLGQLVSNLLERQVFQAEDDRLEAALDSFLASPPYKTGELGGEPFYAPDPEAQKTWARRTAAELSAELARDEHDEDPLDPRSEEPDS